MVCQARDGFSDREVHGFLWKSELAIDNFLRCRYNNLRNYRKFEMG